MLININNNAWLYRMISILIGTLLYSKNIALFYSQYENINLFNDSIKKISNNYLADLIFENNNWHTNKLYSMLIILGYILLYNTINYIKSNNIQTLIT